MVNRWVKTNSLIASTAALWLVALSPVPNWAKGISYSLALVSGVQLVQESKRLIMQSARTLALEAINQDLEQLELALHTHNQEEALAEAYAPEVKQELERSLEHLYSEPSASHPSELQTSTSERKALYLALKSLLEVKSKTYVLEQVLKLRGGHWDKGEAMLQEILDEGDRNGW